MNTRFLLLITLGFASAAANAQQFDKIQNNRVITVVLPGGNCDARVVRVAPDQLTVKLKKTTPACGQSKSLATLSIGDVRDVVDNRPRGRRPDPSLSPAGVCTLVVTTLVAATAGFYLGETNHAGQALGAVAGGGVAGGALCFGVLFPRRPRYSVFISRIEPIQP